MHLIKLTDFQSKDEFFLRADLIIKIDRASDNRLVTLVTTNMMTPKGLMIIGVLESPQSIADAMRHGDPKLN